jgi:phosphate transport system permease protein
MAEIRKPFKPASETRAAVEESLAARYGRERRFQAYGIAAIVVSVAFVMLFFFSIILQGYGAFSQTFVKLEITFDEEVVDPAGTRQEQALSGADYNKLVKNALLKKFPDVSGRSAKRQLYALVSNGAAYDLRDAVLNDPGLVGRNKSFWFPVGSDIDQFVKGNISRDVPENERRVKDRQIVWVDELLAQGLIEQRFNEIFFTAGDSRDPELAGIWGAAKGSFFMLIITMALAFPLGVAAAIYLEEFAPKNRWIDLVEVNINNLAAVPSIVFGLLGLAVFINFMSLPRSAPLVGGLVLALMTMPTVIIASRSAITAVPPSIREAALGLGASSVQTVMHHVLPLAMPGMLTGAILGLARALGETAPLLMIGMVAFIVEPPQTPLDPASALPVQIYLWADSPERAFVERTAAAIMVLLAFLLVMNASAVWLRSKYERRW